MPRKSRAIVTPPTFEDRLNASAAKREAALSVFELAARDLDEAAAEARETQEALRFEIGRLQGLEIVAGDEAADAEIKAGNIRALLDNGITPV